MPTEENYEFGQDNPDRARDTGRRVSEQKATAAFEQAKAALQAASREHLGREITDREIEGWWTGAYGWGPAGIEGLEGWLRGIRHEGNRLKTERREAAPVPASTLGHIPGIAGGSETQGDEIQPEINVPQPARPAPPVPQPARPAPPEENYEFGQDNPAVPQPTRPAPPAPRPVRRNTMPIPTTDPDVVNTDPERDPERRDVPQRPDDVFTDSSADYARAKAALEAASREHLGREMTEAEFNGWWTGVYGWGKAGIDGLDGWLRGIKHEGDRLKAEAAKNTQATGGVPARTGAPPPGWDPVKWADPDHHTVKYDAAAFLYGLTKPSEIRAMVESARFQERFPGATFDGKDKIDFGTLTEDGVPVGIVDVLMSADRGGDTSAGLWWGAAPSGGDADPTGGDTGPTGAGPTGAGPTGGPTGAGPTGGWTPDTWAEALVKAQGGSPLMNPAATPGPQSMGYGMGPGGGGGTMGQMITPYNPLETYSPVPWVPSSPFRPPAYEGATPFQQDAYQAAAPFTGPTAADMTADPGYQFRLQQGQEALERSGAARGVTNTGGTLRNILDYGQQAASQEYGNVFGRQRDIYDLNERNRFNAYEANWGNAMEAYRENERNRAGAFDTNVMNARDAYEMNERNRYQGYTTNELARLQENQEAENRRSGAYGTNLGTYERQQQYGLRAQGQGFDQSFRNWQEQYNQGRMNAQDTYNRMYGLSTT